jgi:hypothetical protein
VAAVRARREAVPVLVAAPLGALRPWVRLSAAREAPQPDAAPQLSALPWAPLPPGGAPQPLALPVPDAAALQQRAFFLPPSEARGPSQSRAAAPVLDAATLPAGRVRDPALRR